MPPITWSLSVHVFIQPCIDLAAKACQSVIETTLLLARLCLTKRINSAGQAACKPYDLPSVLGFYNAWHGSRKVCLLETNLSEAEHLIEAARQAAQDAHLRAQEALAKQRAADGARLKGVYCAALGVRNSLCCRKRSSQRLSA